MALVVWCVHRLVWAPVTAVVLKVFLSASLCIMYFDVFSSCNDIDIGLSCEFYLGILTVTVNLLPPPPPPPAALCLCLSLSRPLSLSVCRSVCLSLSFSLSLPLSLARSVTSLRPSFLPSSFFPTFGCINLIDSTPGGDRRLREGDCFEGRKGRLCNGGG